MTLDSLDVFLQNQGVVFGLLILAVIGLAYAVSFLGRWILQQERRHYKQMSESKQKEIDRLIAENREHRERFERFVDKRL